jgi:hypothetical protein
LPGAIYLKDGLDISMQLEDFMECIEVGEVPPEPPDGLTRPLAKVI